MRRRVLLIAAPALLASTAASASDSRIAWGSILIYQAETLDAIFPDDQELSAYIRRLKNTMEQEANASEPVQTPGVLFAALAPDSRSRVWLLATGPGMTISTRERWERALSAIDSGVRVRGYFLFGLSFGVGGDAPFESSATPPLPPEWEAQIPPQGVMLDDAFIGRVWRAPN